MKVILIALAILAILFVVGFAVFLFIIAKVGGKVFGKKKKKQDSSHIR